MQLPILTIERAVKSQATEIPELYGQVDFETTPERISDNVAESALRGDFSRYKSPLAEDPDLVQRMRLYTMLGDSVADPYAALIPTFGFRRLVGMLMEACEKGVEKVEGAPDELVVLIRDMERTPSWLDMALVENGAELERSSAAIIAPWAIRGGLIATFMNKYAALPMALTGTLSNNLAARRVKETATFFSTSVLPGALGRFGEGFKAAAMVRLMHSMVRFNALRSGAWSDQIYGIPIPQVDQMPAGLTGVSLLSMRVLKSGRTEFTTNERARVEFSRYRCFLLGLPEDLLADTPQSIIDTMAARQSSLRKGFDDATCGELVRATMSARLADDDSFMSNVRERFEKSFSKTFFVRNFLSGDTKKAADLGVRLSRTDRIRAGVVLLWIVIQLKTANWASRVPGMRARVDRSLIQKIRKQLAGYGHAEFVTDPSTYKSPVLERHCQEKRA